MSKLYPYQERVLRLLQQGKNVIIQAPTGAGKTRAALYPYFHMLDAYEGSPDAPLPPTCRYAVPMRVLANQFEREFRDHFDKLDRTHGTDFTRRYREKLGFQVPAIQTGDMPNDPAFESPLTFCTIDQLLASFIGTPYSISPRMANLNVGAVAGSYLILDEFHLYPLEKTGDGARMTTLAMLQLLAGFSPFVLMTATFSTSLLQSLGTLLNAEVVQVTDEAELATIMRGRARTVHRADAPMSPDAILAAHAAAKARGAGASLVVCNTVARAQEMYVQVRDALEVRGERDNYRLMILHSRFTPEDRKRKSDDLEGWLGEEQWHDGQFLGKDTIVIGTQVVEVGLNISAGVLHTELAPANSVIQRAGRCARFAGQQGEVIVYPIAPRENAKGEMQVSYKPYDDALCQATWDHLGYMIGESGDDRIAFGFPQEQKLIDAVHTQEDQHMLESYSKNKVGLHDTIMNVLATHERGREGELIRNVTQVSVVIHPAPEEAITVHPFAWDAFGLHPGTLVGAVEALEQRRAALGPNGPDWTFRELLPAGDASSDDLGAEADNDRTPHYTWDVLTVADPKKAFSRINSALRLALPPQLAAYDAELGFRLLTDPVAPAPENGWQSHERATKDKKRRDISGKQGSYVEHISGLMRAYRFSVQHEFGWIAQRLEHALDLPTGQLDLALRLAIACHDIGKLSMGWQHWAHAWQKLLVRKRGDGYRVQEGRAWLAKTDRLDPREWHIEQEWQRELGIKRPYHSGEGAIASLAFLGNRIADVLTDAQKREGGLALWRATISAIARHHSPTAKSHLAVAWDPNALTAINEALTACGLPSDTGKQIDLRQRGQADIPKDYLLKPDSNTEINICATWLGFALVRALRLCDQRAERDL
jgi:CRISPR-associated endonuclease/helicase Cas3